MSIPTDLQQYIDDNQRSLKPKKNNRPMGFMFIALVIVITLVVVFAFIERNDYRSDNSSNPPDSFVGSMTDVVAISAIRENYKDGPSDIAGMTKSQKIDAGLNPRDGSDTDMDGLSDKEEIENYKSDPLKVSTAGDLFTDGYKVANNMDLNKRYDYDGDISHTTDGITLIAASPFDLDARIYNCTDSLENYKKYEADKNINYDDVYEVYKINGYSNNTFNITKADAFINNIPAEDEKVSVKVFRDNESESIDKTDINENDGIITVTLPENMSPMATYTVFLYKDRGAVMNFISSFNDTFSGSIGKTGDEDTVSHEYQSLITIYPLMGFLFNQTPNIYISDTITEQELKDTIRMANACYDECYPIAAWSNKNNRKSITIENCKVIPKGQIKRRTESLESVFGRRHMFLGLMSERMFFSFCYSPLDQYTDIYAAERKEREELAKKFSNSDRFCFKNFNTDYYADNHGVCSGYAWIVSLVHENDGLKTLSGDYTSTVYKQNVSYNMDIDNPDNLTLLDRYLGDYKAYKYKILAVGDKAFDGPRTEDEEEFAKMVSAYWAHFNDELNNRDVALSGFISNKSRDYLSWKTIDAMREALDNDKILLWSFNVNNEYGMAHTVNLIGYDAYDCDGENDTVVFDVYDSNFPNDTFELKCKKIISSRGDESFTYQYSSDGYTAGFDFTESPLEKGPFDEFDFGDMVHTFYVMDSNLNCLNIPLELK